jgi:hypothetical protein
MTRKQEPGANNSLPPDEGEDAQPDRRWAQRRGIALDADITDRSGFTLPARITDISEEGCRIRTFSAPALERDLLHTIKITGLEPVGAYVIWTREDGAGFTFSTPLDPATVRSLVTKSLYARMSRRLARGGAETDDLGTLPPFPFEE